MGVSVAVIGSGPSGFYVSEALAGQRDDCRVDIIDMLPTPFGLVRNGVAPDHQGSKKIIRTFEKIAARDNVRFLGNVKVGRDISLEELRELYDAVVIASGAPLDRDPGLPGGDKKGVIGSAAVVGWYNGHPDYADLAPRLDVSSVAVIGQGNVAVDVVRVLAKTPAEMTESDLADHAAALIHQSPIKDLYMVGRRGPVEAAFTNKELSELGVLKQAVPRVDASQLPETVPELGDKKLQRVKEKNLATLREFAARREDKPRRIHILFYAAPRQILGGAEVEGVRFERTRLEDGRAVGTGEFFDIPCGLVVTCTGYRSQGIEGAPFDESKGIFKNQDGRIAPGLYVVGWAKRGPTGVISTNYPDGVTVGGHVLEDLARQEAKAAAQDPQAIDARLAERGVRVVSFDDWQKINEAETKAAANGSPRRKLVKLEDMLAVLGG